MRLIVLIPAYNEENHVGEVINQIPTRIKGINELFTLVVDDGSTDNTAKEAEIAGVIVVSHVHNLGLGYAFNTGLNKALEMRADIMVNIDADGQFSPNDIPHLIAPILRGEADFVTGDRFTDEDGKLQKPKNMSDIKFWGNKRMSELISLLTDDKYNDVSCGFRAYSKEALLQLNLTGKFTYTQETFIDLSSKGLTIKTVPVSVKYFPDRNSRVANNILKYMGRTTKIIFRAYRDYKPLRFFGWLGLVTFIIGIIFGVVMMIIYLQIGKFTPFKFIGFTGIYFVSLGILFWVVGLLADMFVKVRQTQEKILYFEKKRRYEATEVGR
jgi:glycosyltransferase involved in cell wall biosynthesis